MQRPERGAERLACSWHVACVVRAHDNRAEVVAKSPRAHPCAAGTGAPSSPSRQGAGARACVGSVAHLARLASSPSQRPHALGEPVAELERFHDAAATLRDALHEGMGRLEAEGLSAEAAILGAHSMMLLDPVLTDRMRKVILTGLSATDAVDHVFDEFAELMSCSTDPVLAERSSDLRDLAQQLQARLGSPVTDVGGIHMRNAIVVVAELFPSMVIEAHARGALGFVVRRGTAVSHGAILASAFGLPALRVPEAVVQDGVEVLLDADDEWLLIDPPAALRMRAASTPAPAAPEPEELGVELWLSITAPSQLDGFADTSIAGVGLYRTETLFLQRRAALPDEEEQYQVYRETFELAGARPVTLRTVDLGGDKPSPHIRLGPQQNPYLGLRAHRLFHYHPEIIITQLRAMLRAAAGDHELRILFPMIECVEQWDEMRRYVNTAVSSLESQGVAFAKRFELGLLVETPSAAWGFADLLAAVDFVSIGTNDLVQYFFAAERGCANVARSYRPEHPVFLRLLASLVEQANDFGKPISICGEIAGDPDFIPVLVGLGYRQLTMSRGRLGAARRRMSEMTPADCAALAAACVNRQTAREVREILGMVHDDAAHVGMAGVDPMCGMLVDVADPVSTFIDVDDGRVHFCSSMCRRRFEAARPMAPIGETVPVAGRRG